MVNQKKNLSILLLSMDSGGTEKVISLLLKKLKNDFNVTLVLFYNVIHFPIPEGINVKILSQKEIQAPFYRKLFDLISCTFKYSSLLKNKNINVSLTFLPIPNFINGIIAIKSRKIKTIISERSFPSTNPKTKLSLYISKVFYPILYNRCDGVFSNSIYINNDLKNNFGVKIPMEVIYNPMESPNETINPQALEKLNNSYKVIAVGTLNNKKNHLLIIKALATAKDNYKLNILGDGPLKSLIEKEIETSGLEKQVFLKGKVKNVNDYLLQSHCFVLSSNAEGFPNALLEAMAIGLPCISTNCLSGPLEMLNENIEISIPPGEFYKAKYGILINTNDVNALIQALNFLKNNPKERVKYSKLSLERSKKYHLESIYSEFVEYIKK